MSGQSILQRNTLGAVTAMFVSAIPVVGACHDEPEDPMAPLKKGLMASLGESFEYLDGEVGQTKGRWFWFARVRPLKAGEFAFSYSIRFEYPETVEKRWRREPATYLIPIVIGERGASRVVMPGSRYGGSTYPHANVGDILLIPINVDRFVTDHVFAAVPRDERERLSRSAESFFRNRRERSHENWMAWSLKMNGGFDEPVVRNDAGKYSSLLSTWYTPMLSRAKGGMFCTLTAYLEFTQPTELNLAGRLREPDGGDKGPDTMLIAFPMFPMGLPVIKHVASTPIRVVPKGQPVTVVVEHIAGATTWRLPPGTIEARVGDKVVVDCGRYGQRSNESPGEKPPCRRSGVVMPLPFAPAEPYTVGPLE